MRYLITGASGLLGKQLTSRLPHNSEVYKAVRYAQASDEISVDLSEANFVEKLPGKVDVVVHLAQSNQYRNVPDGNLDVFGVNLHATFQLLEYARSSGASKFLFASTGSVYDPSNKPHEEHEQIIQGETTNLYAATKLAAESLVMSYRNFFEVYVPRYFFLFGPRQNQNMLFPRLLKSLREKDEIQLSGDRGITINPTPAALAASVTLDLLNRGKTGIYNVASSNRHSLSELVNVMAKSIGVDPNIAFTPSAVDVIASTEKLSKATNLELDYNLKETLSEFIATN